jgi:hypothetical protein
MTFGNPFQCAPQRGCGGAVGEMLYLFNLPPPLSSREMPQGPSNGRRTLRGSSAMMMVAALGVLFFPPSAAGSEAWDEAVVRFQQVQDDSNHSLTFRDVIPNTTGWLNLLSERLLQVTAMDHPEDRYEGYYQTMMAAIVVPNFTEYGLGLAKCPDSTLLMDLQQAISDGMETAEYEEGEEDVVNGPEQPWFIHQPELLDRVLYEMRPFVEAWAGIPLVPHQAYGFRVYRNDSQLYMHLDRLETHVISFILHIDSSPDAEPWPLFIEDFHGRTHEVVLTRGDMLFYESSKCFHGRPRPFRGTWYTSVFVHYHPTAPWLSDRLDWEAHTRPRGDYAAAQASRLEMVDTALREPDCPVAWCRSQEDTVRWGGPALEGLLTNADGTQRPFFSPPEPLVVHAGAVEEL